MRDSDFLGQLDTIKTYYCSAIEAFKKTKNLRSNVSAHSSNRSVTANKNAGMIRSQKRNNQSTRLSLDNY
jgi:hypothetical protein